jgi:RHS repeat-associated protein
VEKVVGVGTYTEYAYDAGGQVIGTHDRSSWPQEVVPHSALPTPLAKYQDAGTYFVHPNLLRSSTKLTDHSGTGSDELFFHAWGEKWFPESGTLKDYRFASMTIRDDETTLDPTLYRNYSSRLGRWLTPDPASCGAGNPQNLNRYPYGANNPANRIDPTGLQPLGGWICFISPWDDPCSDFIFYAFHPVECFAYQGLGFYNPWSGFPPVPSPPRWLCIWIGMGGGEQVPLLYMWDCYRRHKKPLRLFGCRYDCKLQVTGSEAELAWFPTWRLKKACGHDITECPYYLVVATERPDMYYEVGNIVKCQQNPD